jgi:hypothetical protein
MQHDFILLDRSGSMGTGGKWAETIGAINGYVQTLAEKNVDTGVTLICFDRQDQTSITDMSFDIVRDRIIPKTWAPVSPDEVVPRAYTPLNDATARLINRAAAGGYDKLALIIVTDGYENASREFQGHAGTLRIRSMLDECRAKGWQIIFLGANFDNAVQAQSYGAATGQAVTASTGMLHRTFTSMAGKRADYATGAAANMSYTDEEKKKFAAGLPGNGGGNAPNT